MYVLVLNAGSSSQKCSLYDLGSPLPDQAPTPLWEGKIAWGRGRSAELRVRAAGQITQEELPLRERVEFIGHLLQSIWSGAAPVLASPEAIGLIGHRVVHGGDRYVHPVLVTEEVEQAIGQLAEFAPVHIPANLEGIRACRRLFPHVRQVAVFDTAFHRTIPPAARVYPGPYEWLERGIRRYGFHGISHEYAAQRTAALLRRPHTELRLVSCHLGNGCSLAAIAGGQSVDTTMGFTPLEGLMMGNRSGSVDPGILLYLLRRGMARVDELDTTLNRHSGLLGISGVSEDMREVLRAARDGHARAKLALDLYVHRLRQGIAAMVASLEGADAITFTGGVGENASEIRARTCAGLRFLGVRIDDAANQDNTADRNLAAPGSAMAVLVITAQEDWAIAAVAWRLLQPS